MFYIHDINLHPRYNIVTAPTPVLTVRKLRFIEVNQLIQLRPFTR